MNREKQKAKRTQLTKYSEYKTKLHKEIYAVKNPGKQAKE
jgi:hypothetical protein